MDGRSLGKTGGVELHDRAVVRHWVADLRLRLLAAAMERDAYILKVPACAVLEGFSRSCSSGPPTTVVVTLSRIPGFRPRRGR